MLKTPISVLQEFAVQQKWPLPEYEFSSSGETLSMTFVCNVKLGNEKAVGSGATKKGAKHASARNLLERFGVEIGSTEGMSNICLLPTKTRRDAPVLNYVGKLNEFSSQKRFAQPRYTDSPILHEHQFCVTCNFLQFKTEGSGPTKKEAKQEAAKNMLILARENNRGSGPLEEVNQMNSFNAPNNENYEEKVLQKYTDIMKNISVSNMPILNNNSQYLPKKLFTEISTWDELVIYMNNQGWRHGVTVFQAKPLMLCLKINEHILINYGETQEEIKGKFVPNVVQMLETGTNFNEPLIH